MPIYCYKCNDCGKVHEYLSPSMSAPANLPHRCTPDKKTKMIRRHYASEVPKTHTQGTYGFKPFYDAGAGRKFETKAEYTRWQASKTGSDGVAPEPMSGRRGVSFYEEAAQANHINKSFQIDESAERRAIGKAYDEAHRELAGCAAMGIKPPSLDD